MKLFAFSLIVIVSFIIGLGLVKIVQLSVKTAFTNPALSPPPTQEELDQFRIVKSQDGVFAIEQLVGGRWELRPNRWQNTNQCYKDMEWWIEQYRIRKVGESRVFTPIQK